MERKTSIAIVFDDITEGTGGVSDYCFRFSKELRFQNKATVLVSFASSKSGEATFEGIPHLLLEATMPAFLKRRKMLEFFLLHHVETLFLQVVPYAFHHWGWMGGSAEIFPRGEQKLMIMFHEIWVGASQSAPCRHRILGIIQKYGIQKFLGKICPDLVFTSNAVYQNLLMNCGISVKRLPLFGNIQVYPDAIQNWRIPQENTWKGIIFGTLHQEWPIEPLLGTLLRISERLQRNLEIISVGRIGAGINVWRRMQESYKDKINFRLLGELQEERVSHWLRYADFGIATTPWENIGKSGSALAMIEHGLPVVVNRREDYDVPSDDPLHHHEQLIGFDNNFEEKMVTIRKGPLQSNLPAIVSSFLEQIQ